MYFELNHYKPGTTAYISLIQKGLPDGKLKYLTKESIDPRNWVNGKSKDTKQNARLNRMAVKLQDVIDDYAQRNKPLTRAIAEHELDTFLHRKKDGSNFFDVVDEIINQRASGLVLTDKGKRFSEETLKGYRHSRDLLQRYDASLTFDRITVDEYEKILSYFTAKNYATNSIGKVIKNLKVFGGAAKKMGYHSTDDYNDFKIPEEKTFDIYLTDEELTRIYKKHLPNKLHDLVRDWFIIDCFTGLRISDIKMLD